MSEPISTSDTPFAAYLIYHGHKFEGMIPDKNDKRRKVFVFHKKQDSDILVKAYYEGEPLVRAQEYSASLRQARHLLYDEELHETK